MKKHLKIFILLILPALCVNGQTIGLMHRNPAVITKYQERSVNFGFRQFCCDHTTEQGADEVYFLILGERSDGKRVFEFLRRPGNETHWDMNDGNQGNDRDLSDGGDSHCLTNRFLATFNLPEGLSYNFTIMVCEEDGGTSAAYQQAAAELLKQSSDPYSLSASLILEVMNTFGIKITDTDDYMGIFGLSVSNRGGNLTSSWVAKEGIVHIQPDADYPGNANRTEIRMNHDGSNYVGWFFVQ